MQARIFSHYFDLSPAIFQVALQVGFLAGRKENSSEMYISGTSTIFKYANIVNTLDFFVDEFDFEAHKREIKIADAAVQEADASSLQDALVCLRNARLKLINAEKEYKSHVKAIYALADKKGYDVHKEDAEKGEHYKLVPKVSKDKGVLIISDTPKTYFCPKKREYASQDPYVALAIFGLVETNALPEGMPNLEFRTIGLTSDGRARYELKVEGSKEEIIRFTNVLKQVAQKDNKLGVHVEDELGKRLT